MGDAEVGSSVREEKEDAELAKTDAKDADVSMAADEASLVNAGSDADVADDVAAGVTTLRFCSLSTRWSESMKERSGRSRKIWCSASAGLSGTTPVTWLVEEEESGVASTAASRPTSCEKKSPMAFDSLAVGGAIGPLQSQEQEVVDVGMRQNEIGSAVFVSEYVMKLR